MNPARSAEKKRWRLWHLLALVAGSAVVLSFATRSPVLLASISFVSLAYGPPTWAFFAWDRWKARSNPAYPDESERGCALLVLAASLLVAYWFALILGFLSLAYLLFAR